MLFVVEGRLEVLNYNIGLGVCGLRYKELWDRFVHYAKRGHLLRKQYTYTFCLLNKQVRLFIIRALSSFITTLMILEYVVV